METKICTKCNKELLIEEFNWRNKAKGTRRSECKYCHSAYMKIKYKEKKTEIQDLKLGLKCAKCGYDKCGAALVFHHVDPTEKDETIARMLSNNYKLDIIWEEIKKCIVLCANCHHEFHFLNNNNKDYTIDMFLQEE